MLFRTFPGPGKAKKDEKETFCITTSTTYMHKKMDVTKKLPDP
jgi:hypothetical protein